MDTHSTEFIQHLIAQTQVFTPLIVWFVVLMSGENGAIITFALAAQGILHPISTVVSAFCGTFAADLFWYGMTTGVISPFHTKFFQKKQKEKPSEKRYGTFLHLADRHPYIVLTLLKFMVGLRLILTIYILHNKHIPFRKYFACTVIGNILFITILFPIGWYLGKGAAFSLNVKDSLSTMITFMVIVLLGSEFISLGIRFLFNKMTVKKSVV